MKYIDAEKLKVLIQQLIGECIRNNWSTTEYCLRKILSVIDSLQQEQPNVNIEEEVEDWVKIGPHTSYPWCTIPDAIRITAEHFYELGLKAKGE
jgi:hypothetical protein